jgi:hypothetical protein
VCDKDVERRDGVIVIQGGDGTADDTQAIQEALDRALGCRRQDVPERATEP